MKFEAKYILIALWLFAIGASLYFLTKVDSLFTNAQQPIAQVSRLKGAAEMRHGAMVSWSPIQEGAGIADKTIVATSAKSALEVTFQDGRRIRVGENSQIYVTVESQNKEFINTVTLIRGDIATLKPLRQKSIGMREKTPRPLVVKESQGKQLRVDRVVSNISLKRDPDAPAKGSEKVTNPAVQQKVDSESKDLFALGSMSPPPRAAESQQANVDPFKVSLAGSMALAPPIVAPVAKVSTVKVPMLKPSIPSVSPTFPRPVSLPKPPSLASKSKPPKIVVPEAQDDERTRILNDILHKVPAPVLEFADSSMFCTFDNMGAEDKMQYFDVPMRWDPPRISPSLENASYAMVISNGAADGEESKIVKIGVLSPGKNSVRVDLDSLIGQSSDQEKPIVRRVPLKIEVKINKVDIGSSELDVRTISVEKNISLCSIHPVTEQAYTISLDRLMSHPKNSDSWFLWDESRRSYRYKVRVESLDLLRKMQPLLQSAGSFRITNEEASAGKQVVYYIKNEKIIGSVYGEVPSRSEITLLEKTFDPDLTFLSRSGEFIPLEKAATRRMLMIDKALRANEKIFLFVNGRLITVTKDEVGESSGLVRSYLQSTWGVFISPPKIL